MFYLISQVLLLLALASLISGLIGWLLRAFQSDRNEVALKARLENSQRTVPSMRRALDAAHFEIDRRDSDIHKLRRKIAEIDSDPNNFRQGDFDNLGNMRPEERAQELVHERVISGNSQFRSADFSNGIPSTASEQDRAAEFLNTRIEDTDGKYRATDFANGQPAGREEQQIAAQLDQQRVAPKDHYREGDFNTAQPKTAEEQRLAEEIKQLRNENKAHRIKAKRNRRVLAAQLNEAQEGLVHAQARADEITSQLAQNEQRNSSRFARLKNTNRQQLQDVKSKLGQAKKAINGFEKQIADLKTQIKAIDNNPANFRAGDFEDLQGKTPDEVAFDHHLARVNSGNTSFRQTDFVNGKPVTAAQQVLAVEYTNSRVEGTDGKYRTADFANGAPSTAEEKLAADQIDAKRVEPETHFRDGDFENGTPQTDAEKRQAKEITNLRDENKADRIAARENRRVLVRELDRAHDSLADARNQANDLTAQLQEKDANSNQQLGELENALSSAHEVIEKQEKEIKDLTDQIKAIDNNPVNFRGDDLDNLNAEEAERKIADLHVARVESGNTGFRKADFHDGIPSSDAEKLRAVEFMNTRDEDTDGKYRATDFANGTPVTDSEKELSKKIDDMREEMQKHYRANDFASDGPKSVEEQRLAAEIQQLRDNNKAQRQKAKRDRRVLVAKLDEANAGLAQAQAQAEEITRQQAENDQRTKSKITELEDNNKKQLDNVKSELDKANKEAISGFEKQVADLKEQIKTIDNSSKNFREGDLNNLDAQAIIEKIADMQMARVESGNTGFRKADFKDGIPNTEAEKLRAVEFMNVRDEDTNGKYRETDFADGTPITAAEKELSKKIDDMREEMQKHYRADDFESGAPKTAEEQRLAAEIQQLRDKNKAQRQKAKRDRRVLVAKLDEANAGLANAQAQAEDMARQQEASDQRNKSKFAKLKNTNQKQLEDVKSELNKANEETIANFEKQVADLKEEIKSIDNNPQNFREGDLTTPEAIAAMHMARVNSGNTGFRQADFVNGIPSSHAEKLRAIEFMNNRDEDTDGKYREGDFANGVPVTPAEKALGEKIDNMRQELEKHYRESDFAGEQPQSEEEIKLAARIDVLRAKNKTKRKLAKSRRRDLVKQLNSSKSQLEQARAEIDQLQNKINAAPSQSQVSDLEKALADATGVIDQRENRINELETQIQKIDTDANHFRAGDLDNLDEQSAMQRAMEIAITRATSGNSQFRGTDFNGRVPLTDEEKSRAIEFLAERDEDTDGKYRQADFAGGEPKTETERARAAALDGMRTEPEKHYRDTDFDGDKPQSEEEIKLAARIDAMRLKNKAYRSASKKQRKVLKQDLINAQAEKAAAQKAVAELESRIQGVSNTNDSLEDIIASLKQDISTTTALEKQSGKKADELALTIDKLERELIKTTHDGHKKTGDLDRELDRAKDDLAAALKDASLNKQALESAQATLTERNSEREKLQEQYAQQKTDLALARSELAQKSQELVKLDAEKDREIHELKYTLTNQQEINKQLEQDLVNLRGELQAALNDDSDRVTREALEISKAATEARVNELEAALRDHANAKNHTWEELKKELDSLTISLRLKDTDLVHANSKLANMQDDLAEYEANDGELRNRIEVLESMLSEQRQLRGKSMSSRIREIEAMLAAERRKVESLTVESSVSEITTQSISTPRVVTSHLRNISTKKD